MIFPDGRTREHFGKLLRMLGSDQSGERAVAALKATQLLLAHGLDWHAVTSSLCTPTPQYYSPRPRPRPARSQTIMPHNTDAADCLKSGVVWQEHEEKFLKQMKTLGRAPTEKQANWLAFLVGRAAAEGQEAA